jgi:hypothetical protein
LDEKEDLGPIPFKFNPQWIKQEGFMEVVTKAWSTPVTGSPSFVWEQKLKVTKSALKEWVKSPSNPYFAKRKEVVQQLADIQMDMESQDITTQSLEKEQAAQHASHRAFRHEEEYWKLKSRSLWLAADDRNTAFFHRQFRARLSRNHISKITTTDGTVSKGFAQIKAAAKFHFQELYTEDGIGNEVSSADFLSHMPHLVSNEINASLLKLFFEEEINKVVWDMESDKAPGLDGFSIHFYKAC